MEIIPNPVDGSTSSPTAQNDEKIKVDNSLPIAQNNLNFKEIDEIIDAYGYMYILQCSDGSFYTGSTKNLKKRLEQHKNEEGANYTKLHSPIRLVYYETFDRIDEAFEREKQIQK